MLEGDHAPRFTTRNLLKDLGHARDLDDRESRITDEARRLLEETDPDLDYGALARHLMDLP